MLNDSRTSGSLPGGVLIPMPRARIACGARITALRNRAHLRSRISRPCHPACETWFAGTCLPPTRAHGCVAVVLCSVLVAACGKTDPALDNDAYVWQRRWTPAVTAAMSRQRRSGAGLARAGRRRGPGRQVVRRDARPAGPGRRRPARHHGAALRRPRGRFARRRDPCAHRGLARFVATGRHRAGGCGNRLRLRHLQAAGVHALPCRLRARLDPSIPCPSPPCRPGWTVPRSPPCSPSPTKACCRSMPCSVRRADCSMPSARRPGWTPTRRRPASPGAWPCPPTAVASPGTTRAESPRSKASNPRSCLADARRSCS